MRSMTGFGSASTEVGRFSLAVEIRSVNGKGLRLSLRLDDTIATAENENRLRAMVSSAVSRGRVTLTARLTSSSTLSGQPELDGNLAARYLELAEKLSEEHGIEAGITAGRLLEFPGVLGTPDPSREDPQLLSDALLDCSRRALEAFQESRAREGANLVEAMSIRVRRISTLADEVMREQDQRVERRFQALKDRVARLLESPPEDESRLFAELALLADKVDVSEEQERLRSHISASLEIMESGKAEGRKLGFIFQEMHRELNTMGSKVDDAEAQMQVVQMKNDLAALREQVANLE